MAIKELKKTVKPARMDVEKKVQEFISKGGGVQVAKTDEVDEHRLTLRIPRWLMGKIDEKRKKRIGTVSRNLWILEELEKSVKE